MKISFDFDCTLSEPHVQFIAERAIKEGHDVYITTSRFEDKTRPDLNRDLYLIAKKIGILKEKIRFCDGAPKHLHLAGFDKHYDDDAFAMEDIVANNEEIELLWCIDSTDILNFREHTLDYN